MSAREANFKYTPLVKVEDAPEEDPEDLVKESSPSRVDPLYCCENGHPLAEFATEVPGYSCDVCGKSFPAGAILHGCRECEWDKCSKCLKKQMDKRFEDADLANIGKADILRWFKCNSDADVQWILHRLAEIMPHSLFDALAEKVPGMSQTPESPSMSDLSPKRKRSTKDVRRNSTLAGDPIIQFASSIYYAEEAVHDVMVLDVIRIGSQHGTSEVSYETEDDSAVSGRSFVATSGQLVFEPGVSLLHIQIPIINNLTWDTTLEFKCKLTDEGLHGAILGQYLHTTRVKIIDHNHFPTDDFSQYTTPKEIAASPKWTLLFGMLKWICNIPVVWSGTKMYVAIDICQNMWDLLLLYMNVYLLDYIVDTKSPRSALLLTHSRHFSLVLCAVFILIGIGLFHISDYLRYSYPVPGPAKNFIQDALLRKFLNYKRTVRERMMPGEIIMGMHSDATDVVELGYVNALKMIKAVCKLAFMVAFQLSVPLLFGGDFDWHAFALLFSTPFFLAVFVACREDTTGACLKVKNTKHSLLTNEISSLTTNFHLVIDYQLRNHCEYRFKEKQRQNSLAVKQALQVLENNMYFCEWCTSGSKAMWVVYGGTQVMNGTLTVGLFVTNLTLFQSVGQAFLTIYSILIAMMQSFPALVNITTLMNQPTDVKQRAILSRHQQAQAGKSRQTMMKKWPSASDEVPVDTMPITLKFNYPFKYEGLDGTLKCTLNFRGHVSFVQGQLVAVAGPLGCGKATLLHLLAGSVLPEEGRESPVFVPAHLRVANVADEALFFGGTLYENLTFGMSSSNTGATRHRVKSICKRLTKSDVITDFLEEDEEHPWPDIFSVAQCKLLSVARALVHNVEVLTIHKPLARLNHEDSVRVIRALHDHIYGKGLDLATDISHRRPRTVIVSASHASDRACKEAHNVIVIDPLHGIRSLQSIQEANE